MKKANLHKSLYLLIGAALSISLSSVGFAQDAEDSDDDNGNTNQQLEEVMVTARKREERLQDIPTSASALTADFLENMNPVENIRELTDLIPGITMNDVNLNFVAEPSIRGGGAGRNRYSSSATGLYRSGAYVASAGPGGTRRSAAPEVASWSRSSGLGTSDTYQRYFTAGSRRTPSSARRSACRPARTGGSIRSSRSITGAS